MEWLKRILTAFLIGAVLLLLAAIDSSDDCDCEQCQAKREYEADHEPSGLI
ncbi:MAG: hypothetical protein IJC46_00815 [Clostridia bacterium]|nr:hypothetical protein [Clostridia bacterium]